jgi:hypothetical protein
VPIQPVEYDASHQFAIISGFQLSAILTKPSAGNAAAATNPHRRSTVYRFPAGSFFRGFRTPALYRIDRSCLGRHPKPFRKSGHPSTGRKRHHTGHLMQAVLGGLADSSKEGATAELTTTATSTGGGI